MPSSHMNTFITITSMEGGDDLDQSIERIHIPLWVWLLIATAAFVIYLAGYDNGTALRGAASTVHELFHDGRHFLGVPCH